MSDKKSYDEIYCRSCGTPIKRKAEICPECGVKNQFEESSRNPNSSSGADVEINVGSSGRTSSNPRAGREANTASGQISNKNSLDIDSLLNTEPNDPSEHSTNVSNRWGYGVGASVAFWIVSLALSGVASAFSMFALIAWILMPASMYFDREYLKSTSTWKPKLSIWVLLSVIPLINIVAGGIYIIRRNETEKISEPDENSYLGGSEDPALQKLKERYSRGEVSDSEFESKVEQIVETNDRDS